MANRIVSIHTGIYGIGIYAIMLPSSVFSVAHYKWMAEIEKRTNNYYKDDFCTHVAEKGQTQLY